MSNALSVVDRLKNQLAKTVSRRKEQQTSEIRCAGISAQITVARFCFALERVLQQIANIKGECFVRTFVTNIYLRTFTFKNYFP